jgi:hypothetical protein
MGDYGYVSIMPVAGAKAKFKTHHAAWFSHRLEFSKPYYYSVPLNYLPKKRVFVELTSSVHCGLFRFTFHKRTEHNLFIEASREAGGWIKIDTAKNEVSGYNMDFLSNLMHLFLALVPGCKTARSTKECSKQECYAGREWNLKPILS